MKKSRFPEGWDEKRTQRVLNHYEKQSEEESLVEDKEAYKNKKQATMEIPVQLVPSVRKLIAKYQALQSVKETAKRKTG